MGRPRCFHRAFRHDTVSYGPQAMAGFFNRNAQRKPKAKIGLEFPDLCCQYGDLLVYDASLVMAKGFFMLLRLEQGTLQHRQQMDGCTNGALINHGSYGPANVVQY